VTVDGDEEEEEEEDCCLALASSANRFASCHLSSHKILLSPRLLLSFAFYRLFRRLLLPTDARTMRASLRDATINFHDVTA